MSNKLIYQANEQEMLKMLKEIEIEHDWDGPYSSFEDEQKAIETIQYIQKYIKES